VIHSDKFFVGVNPASYGGLWCVRCLADNVRPALIHEWPGDTRTQNLADLVSRAEAHWSKKHQGEPS
jgi:hypothetical protein